MSDELAALMGTMALYIAHQRDWPLSDAIAWVHGRMAEARDEYRSAGAPLGYTESGFIRWLQPRKPLAPAPSTEHAVNKAQSALDAHS